MQILKNLIVLIGFLLASNYGKKIITKNYANLMCFIKMCKKSRIRNILKRIYFFFKSLLLTIGMSLTKPKSIGSLKNGITRSSRVQTTKLLLKTKTKVHSPQSGPESLEAQNHLVKILKFFGDLKIFFLQIEGIFTYKNFQKF